MLKPIKPKRISDQVYEQLKDLIFKGEIKPGQQLLTERELAGSLGVSRPTVREAINKLVAIGLLEHRQGQGTFVRAPASGDKDFLMNYMEGHEPDLVELLEVRLGIECNAVALAARRATEEDIATLEKLLKAMEENFAAGNVEGVDDVAFHMAIAYATKNVVQIHVMKNFYDLLFYGIKENLEHLYTAHENLTAVIQQHTGIVDGIRQHDPDAASRAMKEHITFVIDFFRKGGAEGSFSGIQPPKAIPEGPAGSGE